MGRCAVIEYQKKKTYNQPIAKQKYGWPLVHKIRFNFVTVPGIYLYIHTTFRVSGNFGILPDRHFHGRSLRWSQDVRLRICPVMLDPTGFHP